MSRPQSLWRLLNLSCDGMSRLASESLDRDLIRQERLALRSHLLYCSPCRRYLKQIVLLRDAIGRLMNRVQTESPLPGTALPTEIRDRIKKALRES